MKLFKRREAVPENPYDRAGREFDTDWMARKFLFLTEWLAEVEAAVVRAYEAADGQALVSLEYGIADAHKTIPKRPVGFTPSRKEDE